MEKKELYRAAAKAPRNMRQTIAALIIVILCVAAVFSAAPLLPFEWFFEIAAITAGAIYTNKILRRGTFTITYILYEDRLIELTRVGLLESQTGEYPLSDTLFYADRLVYMGRTKEFYPDETLKKLLKLCILS